MAASSAAPIFGAVLRADPQSCFDHWHGFCLNTWDPYRRSVFGQPLMSPTDEPELKPQPTTDKALLRRFRSGEQEAAAELFVRYSQRLQKLAERQCSIQLARRNGTDDIIQSVFRTFFRRVAKGQYDVADGEDLWRLLLVLALNKIRNAASFHHAQKRDVRRTREVAPDQAARLDGDDEEALLLLRMTIDEVLAQQSESNRDIIRLRIDGHSIQEISQRTGRAQRTIERVLQSFRKALLAEIGEPDES